MITADKLIKKLEWLMKQASKEQIDYIPSRKVKEYISEHINEEGHIIEDMYNEHNKNGEINAKANSNSKFGDSN